MRLYKLMNARWADELVNHGNLRIGTLYDYGDTEKYGTAIGDDREGYREYYSRSPGVKTLRDLNPLEAALFDLTNVTDFDTVKFHNLNVAVPMPRQNFYLYSTIFSDSMEAQQRINEENEKAGREQYNACVEITRALRFFSMITDHLAQHHSAKPLTRGMCTYADFQIDYNAPPAHATLIPAMVKRRDHAYQMEYRALWQDNKDSNGIVPVNVQIPGIRQYVRRLR